MLTSDVVTHAGEHPYRPDAAPVYCDLFGARVAERVCLLLKKELKRGGAVTCPAEDVTGAGCGEGTEGRQAAGGNVRRSLCINRVSVKIEKSR